MSDDIEALRRDAERYRFLRNKMSVPIGPKEYSGARLDEKLDWVIRTMMANQGDVKSATAPPPSPARSQP